MALSIPVSSTAWGYWSPGTWLEHGEGPWSCQELPHAQGAMAGAGGPGSIFTSMPPFCRGALVPQPAISGCLKCTGTLQIWMPSTQRKSLVFKSIQIILSNANSLHSHSVQGSSFSTRYTCKRQYGIMHFKSVQRADLMVSVLTIIKHFLN